MWTRGQFGAKNVNLEDVRKLVRSDGDLYQEVVRRLVIDGVILSRGGLYVRLSLNSQRLPQIEAILACKVPSGGSFAAWVDQA